MNEINYGLIAAAAVPLQADFQSSPQQKKKLLIRPEKTSEGRSQSSIHYITLYWPQRQLNIVGMVAN